MNKKFLSSLFNKKSQVSHWPNPLIREIYTLQNYTELVVYDNIDIFVYNKKETIPLLIYDKYRGLFLFEIKEWSFQDLQNASITKTEQTKQAQNTLSYSNMQKAIANKLDAVIHTSDIPLHNYLLMTHLSSYEYQNLDDSLKKILIEEKIIFNDLDAKAIFKKLENESKNKNSYGSKEMILGSLLTQYTLLDKENRFFLANQEQKAFINAPLQSLTNIQATPKSGLSSTLLLKAIFEILKNPSLKITIIKPTKLSKDILHRQLLEIIEHAVIDFDVLSITILTPVELEQKKESELDNIILCDDGLSMQKGFIEYLKNLQEKHKILLTNDSASKVTYSLHKSYLMQTENLLFYKTNPYAKTLQLVMQLLKNKRAKEIVIVSNETNRKNLVDDLECFIGEEITLLDSAISLLFQDLEKLKVATYKDLNEIIYNDAILLDIEDATDYELEYVITHAKESVHILYEKEAQLDRLKEIYANK